MVSNLPHPIAAIRREHQLLAILCAMDGASGSSTNDEVLLSYLGAIGLGCPHGDLREMLCDLAGGGLVTLDVRAKLCVVQLTRDGNEVASGVATRDGIARSPPDCAYR